MVDLRFRDIVRFSCGCNMVADFELKKLVKPLQDWFDGHARVLPWRDDPKAYKVWISEIMLQQTRVEAVKPYFARFMEALPDVEALAACPEDRYLKLWEGLGYYNRVRNLHAAAEQIMSFSVYLLFIVFKGFIHCNSLISAKSSIIQAFSSRLLNCSFLFPDQSLLNKPFSSRV